MNDGAITGIPEVDQMRPGEAFHAGMRSAASELARLRAENERLRAALQEILSNSRWVDWQFRSMARSIVERVLNEQSPTSTETK